MDLWQLFPLLILLVISYLIFVIIKPMKNEKSQKFPPGPKKLPILGNLHQVAGNTSNLRRLAKKHGPLMQLQLGSARTVVVSSAKMVKEIFGCHDPVFSGRPPLYVARKLSYGCNNIAFSPPDEHWKALKKMAVVELLAMKRVHTFQDIRDQEVARMLDSILECRGAVDLSQVTLALANNVLCRAVFGTTCGSDCIRDGDGEKEDGRNKLQELLLETQALLGEFNWADFYPWFGSLLNKVNGFDARLDNIFRKLDGFFEDVIEEHLRPERPKADHDDLLDVLLHVLKDPTHSTRLNKSQIKAILLDMFIAGSDPTWATLVWSMTQLVRHPSAMKRAQQEVREAAKGKARLQENDIRELTYLKWVINETLRLHPPNPFPRLTTERCTVHRFEIPANTRVFIDVKVIGLDPEHWDRPSEFHPERFAMECPREEYGFIPFGVGRRGCPGKGFAMAEMEVALANLLHYFDWKLPAGVAVDMAEARGLTTHKTVPLLLMATPVDPLKV